ncbi:MAG: YceI family protein [Alphaproteobacteria bacterium]
MRPCHIVAAALLVLAPAAQAQGVSTDPSLAPAGDYRADKAHTRVIWQVSHLGTSLYTGWFKTFDIALSFDPNAPEKSALTATVDPASVFTLDPAFDAKIAGPEFFDAAKYPEMTFVSTSATRTGEASGTIAGDLTFHGVTRPVTFDVVFRGGMMSPLGDVYVLGFRATAVIRRSEFGAGAYVDLGVGDEVTLTIEGELDQKPS